MSTSHRIKKIFQKDPDTILLFTIHEKHGIHSVACDNYDSLVNFLHELFLERDQYYYESEPPEKPFLSMSKEDADKLPDGTVKRAALQEIESFEKHLKYHEECLHEYEIIESIRSGNKEAVVDFMLDIRYDHEYERITWEELQWA